RIAIASRKRSAVRRDAADSVEQPVRLSEGCGRKVRAEIVTSKAHLLVPVPEQVETNGVLERLILDAVQLGTGKRERACRELRLLRLRFGDLFGCALGVLASTQDITSGRTRIQHLALVEGSQGYCEELLSPSVSMVRKAV